MLHFAAVVSVCFCVGSFSLRMKMLQEAIRIKRKEGGTKGPSRCFMVFRYASEGFEKKFYQRLWHCFLKRKKGTCYTTSKSAFCEASSKTTYLKLL